MLIRNGIEENLACGLASSVDREPRTLAEAASGLAQALASRLHFGAPLPGSSRRVVALVGPTGVGKTTTLAKIAANTALVEHRKVGLVTLDGYRVGATAQLEQYADLIGLPMIVATEARSFARALERLAEAELVLVDTAGRAPRDREALAALAETLHGAGVHVEVCLCLSAASREIELRDTIERHTALLPTFLALTKLDEALRHDSALTACLLAGGSLAWMTAGQRVPEDLMIATPDKLALALCGEETYR
ncbi:MAG: AAA family ATPase [Sandaracinaceae bacterium]|nr:AAA family ATPase [Sandaracinaceae bacterium]